MRSEFEKAYEPNPHKSPFGEVRFNEEKQIYEPLNPPLDRVARSLNAAWYGYRIRQTEVDELLKHKSLQELEINQIAQANQQWQLKCSELQKRVDAAIRLLVEAELYQSEPNIDLAVQALKGGIK